MKRILLIVIFITFFLSGCSIRTDKEYENLKEAYHKYERDLQEANSNIQKYQTELQDLKNELDKTKNELEKTKNELSSTKDNLDVILKDSTTQFASSKGNENNKINIDGEREFLFLQNRIFSLEEELKKNELVSNYQFELEKLDYKDIYSVTKAIDIFKAYASNKVSNDELFKVFRDYIYAMRDYHFSEYTFTYARDNYTTEDYTTNGFMFLNNEGSEELEVDPVFLYNTFKDYLSDGLNEYNLILAIEQKQAGDTYYIMDMALQISWDQLVERIILREKYYNKYKNNEQYRSLAERVRDYNLIFLRIYTGEAVISNTPPYDYDIYKVNEDLLNSYKRFLIEHPNSEYYQTIKELYDILEKDSFIYNEDHLNDFYIKIFGTRLWD